jgi:hypothetical protein
MICFKPSQSINEELLNPVLTIEEIVNSNWKFYNSNGYEGDIRFERDGRVIYTATNGIGFWKFDGKVFLLYNKDRVLHTRMHHFFRDFFGKWHVRGPFLHANDWEHGIIQI